jgi:hypothetical protein
MACSGIMSADRGRVISGSLLPLLIACGGDGTTTGPPGEDPGDSADQNPVPSVTEVSPSEVIGGDDGVTLRVDGSDFVASSIVRWNG